MRANGFAVLALSLAMSAVAGCDLVNQARERLDPTRVDGGQSAGASPELIEEVPTAEPGTDRRQWRAATERTRAVTGNLTVSMPDGRAGPLVLAFGNGLTYELQQLGIQNGTDRTGASAQTFADALGIDPRAGAYIYRVITERIDNVAPEGGLCGEQDRAAFVAISEYVTNAGDWSFKVASFKNAAAPPAPDLQADPGFCGVFIYSLA